MSRKKPKGNKCKECGKWFNKKDNQCHWCFTWIDEPTHNNPNTHKKDGKQNNSR